MTSILKADTIQDTDGNNIINENSNTITIGASGDTTNIIGTLQNNGAAVGGANTPAFSAYSSGNISITNATETTVVFDSEYYDSASAYNVSDGKFTPQTAGKYFISYAYTLDSGQDSNLQYAYGYIEKNTTNLLYTKLDHRGNAGRSAIINGSVIVDMNGSSDFIRIQLYVYANITGSGFIVEPRGTFSGFKIIE